MAKKQDKDLGSEAGKLGGYTPGKPQLAKGPMIVERRVEILIIGPTRGFSPRRPSLERKWYENAVTLGPGPRDYI
jgi:hypothetical protein